MSAPNASSSSSQLVAYAQDIDYTRTEGFKRFKSHFNIKNARCARNDPQGSYPLAKTVYTGGKGSITQWVHAEYMEGSETIRPTFTQWVRGGYFSKVPTKVPTG